MTEGATASNYLDLAADIVSAYVSNNSLPATDLPQLLATVHQALVSVAGAATAERVPEAPVPAVPIKKSVTPDHIVCLEDGRKFKSLKRHLSDGRSQLCEIPVRSRQIHGSRPVPKEPQPLGRPDAGQARQEGGLSSS